MMANQPQKRTQAGIEAGLREELASPSHQAPAKASGLISREDVAKHNTPESSWIIVNNDVYDITSFCEMHPGGEMIIRAFAGKDATEAFYDLHRHEVIEKYGPKLFVGRLADSNKEEITSNEHPKLSAVPYAEDSFWRDGWSSPYLTESHKTYRLKLREFICNQIRPEARLLTETGKVPNIELNKKVAEAGLYAARLGPGPHMKGMKILGYLPAEEFDVFHEMITHEEWCYITGEPSSQDGLGTGLVIGLPPVIHFGSDAIRERIGKECFSGEKRICLAITEPFAGSDVANIKATATKTADGRHYIVSGVKKWITNASFCDYFVTAVRTGGEGITGVSLLLIERSEGVETKPIKTSYGSSAGTAYIIFEDVKVPVENLLGEENAGFQCIMANFNHERWFIVCVILASCRAMIDECFKWCMQRKVFNKKLISQPVIRQKLAHMVAETEALASWLESITYQMSVMDYTQQFYRLGGPIALLKYYSTRISYDVSDNACQIFGGRSITCSGMGKFVEQFQRSVKYGAILGGSEEVMADLGIRLAIRDFPTNARL